MSNIDNKKPHIAGEPTIRTEKPNPFLDMDGEKRNAALAELLPGRTAVLIVSDGRTTQLSYSGERNAALLPQLFTLALWAAQTLARSLGMNLSWIPDQPKGDEIIIAKDAPGPTLMK